MTAGSVIVQLRAQDLVQELCSKLDLALLWEKGAYILSCHSDSLAGVKVSVFRITMTMEENDELLNPQAIGKNLS